MGYDWASGKIMGATWCMTEHLWRLWELHGVWLSICEDYGSFMGCDWASVKIMGATWGMTEHLWRLWELHGVWLSICEDYGSNMGYDWASVKIMGASWGVTEHLWRLWELHGYDWASVMIMRATWGMTEHLWWLWELHSVRLSICEDYGSYMGYDWASVKIMGATWGITEHLWRLWEPHGVWLSICEDWWSYMGYDWASVIIMWATWGITEHLWRLWELINNFFAKDDMNVNKPSLGITNASFMIHVYTIRSQHPRIWRSRWTVNWPWALCTYIWRTPKRPSSGQPTTGHSHLPGTLALHKEKTTTLKQLCHVFLAWPWSRGSGTHLEMQGDCARYCNSVLLVVTSPKLPG